MGGLNMDPRVAELHSIMPLANIGSVMAHHSKRQHLTSAKRAVPPTAWRRALNVVIAPMIDNIRRPSVQSRACAVFHDTLLPECNSGEFRVEHADDLIEELP